MQPKLKVGRCVLLALDMFRSEDGRVREASAYYYSTVSLALLAGIEGIDLV